MLAKHRDGSRTPAHLSGVRGGRILSPGVRVRCFVGCFAVAVSVVARFEATEEPVGQPRQVGRVEAPVAVGLTPMISASRRQQTHSLLGPGRARARAGRPGDSLRRGLLQRRLQFLVPAHEFGLINQEPPLCFNLSPALVLRALRSPHSGLLTVLEMIFLRTVI